MTTHSVIDLTLEHDYTISPNLTSTTGIIDLTVDSDDESFSNHPMLDDSDTDSDIDSDIDIGDKDNNNNNEPPKKHKRRQYDPIKCPNCNQLVPHAFFQAHACGDEGVENNNNNNNHPTSSANTGTGTIVCATQIQQRRSKRRRVANPKYQ